MDCINLRSCRRLKSYYYYLFFYLAYYDQIGLLILLKVYPL